MQEALQRFDMPQTSWHMISRMVSNRIVLAAMAGMLVWLADQPTVDGYHPLLEMFWSPGFWDIPARDFVVLLLSWFVTTLFCHFVLFVLQKSRQRQSQS
jgi:hypothetical protein